MKRVQWLLLLFMGLLVLPACDGGSSGGGTVPSSPPAAAANSTPVALTSPDQNVPVDSLVILRGDGSSDADGDSLTYAWTLMARPAGSVAALSEATDHKCTFTPDMEGNYEVQLMVNDGTEDSVPDTVMVIASMANSAPIANAGADQNVATGTLVTLDGNLSLDADGDPLTNAWTLVSKPAGSSAGLSDPVAAEPTFTADVDGTYEIELMVNDGTVDSASDTVVVTAPLDGAALFGASLCALCHFEGGSGPVVQPWDAIEIQRALDEELVMSGIKLTADEVAAIVLFLAQPEPAGGYVATIPSDIYRDPEFCRICHPRQYQEWQGNMMAYGAISPTFTALESLGNARTGGGLAVDSPNVAKRLFCQRCHTPVSVDLGEFPTFAAMAGRPSSDFPGPVGRRGLSCDYCHQVKAADFTASLLGDGIANVALTVEHGGQSYGPIADPQPNPTHASLPNDYLSSSEFCGACHDVRPLNPDVVTGEPFQRLENLFSEWQSSPWNSTNNPAGRVVSCQDCHMDAGPPAQPGTYYSDESTVYPRPSQVVERRASTHYFTGVDVALTPPEVAFPGQDDPGLDSHGDPIGQVQRREDLLQSACDISIQAPATVAVGGVLPITIDIYNKGAGHNVPSGFSQERQVWIELIVTDDGSGTPIYQSGYLVDSTHPETGEQSVDGMLDDEDLNNIIVTLDPATGDVLGSIEHGPDYDQRHDTPPVNLGLRNFGNEFIHVDPITGAHEEVFIPFAANHMDNSHSIPPLTTESVPYDVAIPPGTVGPLTITARLRFRAFPPRFLRLLAQHQALIQQNLVDEALVDRNKIVEMAGAVPVSVQVQ